MNRIAFSVPRTAQVEIRGVLGESTHYAWIVLHGYGQTASDFAANFAPLEKSQRCFLAPEGLSKFYVKGAAGKVGASWMTTQDRELEIEEYLTYLGKVVDYIARHAPNATIFLLGFSQGAATAARFYASQYRKTISGLVLWGAVFPPDLNFPAQDFQEPEKVYLVYGTSDPLMPPQCPENLSIIRAQLGPFEGGHELPPEVLKKVVLALEENAK